MATYTLKDYYQETDPTDFLAATTADDTNDQIAHQETDPTDFLAATTADDTNDQIAQTFTASSGYPLGKVELVLSQSATSSAVSITIELQGVDGTGDPDGNILATGTIDPDSIPRTDDDREWMACIFSSSYTLISGTSYAIVLKVGHDDAFIKWWFNNGNPYADGARNFSTNGGATWNGPYDSDLAFRSYAINTMPSDKQYSNALVAFAGGTCYYQTDTTTLMELSAASGTLNTNNPLTAVVAFEKVFIANRENLKVADFGNHKFTTDNIAPTDKTCPSRGDLLVGVTSAAEMIVDFITASDGAATVYGKVTSGDFVSGETVRVGDGSTTEFVLTSDSTAGPHWYTWTPYANDTTNYGTLPDYAYLVARYRGRLVLAGNQDYPHQWYMSKVGNTLPTR